MRIAEVILSSLLVMSTGMATVLAEVESMLNSFLLTPQRQREPLYYRHHHWVSKAIE